MTQAIEAFRELGDPTRLQVFVVLLGGRRNVTEIVSQLGLSQPQVSYHLRRLREAGLAVEEREGRWVYYQANWETEDPSVRELLDLTARWTGLVVTPREMPPRASGASRRPGTASGPPAPSSRKPTPRAPRGSEEEERPVVERPPADDDMDDFLL
jgi:DNA-binding transcriptional ArsR family regulator